MAIFTETIKIPVSLLGIGWRTAVEVEFRHHILTIRDQGSDALTIGRMDDAPFHLEHLLFISYLFQTDMPFYRKSTINYLKH